MDDTMGAQPEVNDLLESAVRYARDRHWDVCPGAWLVEENGRTRCSCGDPLCPAPGAHPMHPDWANQASGSPTAARRMWSQTPSASIVLPTGRTFDVLDVEESAGCLALARMERSEIRLGPVSCAPGRRLQFFVLAGSAARLPQLVRNLGWFPESLDLVGRGEQDYVIAPPSRVGPLGPTLWARPPSAANRWLPEAEELIGSLAYACACEAPARR